MKHRYFFFGAVSEEGLTAYCETIEELGCEILQVIPMMVPVKQNVVLGNGQPQMVMIHRVFVRCKKTEWPSIEQAMMKIAKSEGQEKIVQFPGKR